LNLEGFTDLCGSGASPLHGERIHHMLQDKSRTAHRVDVHLIVCGTHCIQSENSLPKVSIKRGRVVSRSPTTEQSAEQTVGTLMRNALIRPISAGFSAQPEMILGGCQWLSCRVQEIQMQGLPDGPPWLP
jgi:hypothetical protein